MSYSDDPATLSKLLPELRAEHRDLDAAIRALEEQLPGADEVQIKRMKKRKLRLKDMISYFENKLIPDLDA
jgi:hypothetical protein